MFEVKIRTWLFHLLHRWNQISWSHRGFNCLVYRQLSTNFMVVTTILFAHTTFVWATCCLICFIPIVKPFLTHWSWLQVVPIIERGNRAHGGCDQSTGDAYSPWYLIPPLIYSEVRVRPFSDLYFLLDLGDWLLIVIFVISSIDLTSFNNNLPFKT
jgi:hypothetical protein